MQYRPNFYAEQRRASGAGRSTLMCGPCGLPCGARPVRGLAKLALRAQTTPALIRPALRSSATHKGSPSPHRWPGLGNGYSGWESISRFHWCGVFAIFLGAEYVYLAVARGHFHAGIFQNILQSSVVCIALSLMKAASDAERLKEALRGAICHGQVSKSEIDSAEEKLGVRFPPSLRLFLSQYGAAFGHGPELAGLPISDRQSLGQPPQWSDLVVENIRARKSPCAPIPSRYLEVSSDGQDCTYLIDLAQTSGDGENPVVALGPGRDFEEVAPSFVAFVEASWSGNT